MVEQLEDVKWKHCSFGRQETDTHIFSLRLHFVDVLYGQLIHSMIQWLQAHKNLPYEAYQAESVLRESLDTIETSSHISQYAHSMLSICICVMFSRPFVTTSNYNIDLYRTLIFHHMRLKL